MTVTNTTKKVTANGNGVATSFSFSPMVIFESSQLLVVRTDADGVETTLSEGTGASAYAVTVASYPGTGSITYPEDEVTPLPTGESITIKRVLTLEQTLDLENQGGYFPDLQEQQFDKLLMIDLQQQEDIDRAFRFPVSFSGISTETDTPAADEVLKINSAGTGMVWASIGSLGAIAASDSTPQDISLSAGAPGTGADYSREDHVHLLPTVTVAKGGTGATNASGARSNLGLGTAAVEDVGVADGNVLQMDATGYPAADGSQITNIDLPRGYIDGLVLSNNATDSAHDIDVAAGAARDGGDAANIILSSTLVKQIDAAWVVGTNQGGLDTGAVAADTWYHLWVIRRSDTGVSDALFSTSATAPTMPTSYDQKRRIGAVLTDASANIIAFSQVGDEFLWDDPPLDVDLSATLGTTARTDALSVPTGLKVHALANVLINHSNTTNAWAYISSPDVNDEAPSETAAPLITHKVVGNNFANTHQMKIRTNTSAQIRARAATTLGTYKVATLGWIDPRGRNV